MFQLKLDELKTVITQLNNIKLFIPKVAIMPLATSIEIQQKESEVIFRTISSYYSCEIRLTAYSEPGDTFCVDYYHFVEILSSLVKTKPPFINFTLASNMLKISSKHPFKSGEYFLNVLMDGDRLAQFPSPKYTFETPTVRASLNVTSIDSIYNQLKLSKSKESETGLLTNSVYIDKDTISAYNANKAIYMVGRNSGISVSTPTIIRNSMLEYIATKTNEFTTIAQFDDGNFAVYTVDENYKTMVSHIVLNSSYPIDQIKNIYQNCTDWIEVDKEDIVGALSRQLLMNRGDTTEYCTFYIEGDHMIFNTKMSNEHIDIFAPPTGDVKITVVGKTLIDVINSFKTKTINISIVDSALVISKRDTNCTIVEAAVDRKK